MKPNPMGPYVDAIRERWWQGDEPPAGCPRGWNIGRELSILKALERQGCTRDELLGALMLYDGSPTSLAVIYARGRRGLLSQLIGEWRKAEAIRGDRLQIDTGRIPKPGRQTR